MDQPPEDSAFTIVKYASKIGEMSAYLTKKPELKEGEKSAAIVWLTGGIPPAGPGSYLWEETKISNEQSARIYRLRGIAMMFPTVRGTVKGNPGSYEGFYGEVEDVIAAGNYLKSLDYVDPKRVYLGGHSSGGTLALLTATATDQFAGVISLGPTEDHYGEDESPFAWNQKEINLRAPIKHLAAIRTPTYIIEGFDDGYSVNQLRIANKNPLVKCTLVARADHFNVIHPVNDVISNAIRNSKNGKLSFKEGEISKSYMIAQQRRREASDLESLAEYRRKGMTFDKPRTVTFYLLAGKKEAFKDIEGKKRGTKLHR